MSHAMDPRTGCRAKSADPKRPKGRVSRNSTSTRSPEELNSGRQSAERGRAGADRGGCRWGRRRPQGPGDEGRTAADELEISRCVRSPQPANKGDRGRYRSDLTVGRSGTSCPLSFCFSQRATLGMSQGSCWEVGGGCPDESRGHETNARLHPRREARALAVSAAHPREACVACFRRDGSAQLCDFWRVVGPLIKKQKEGGYAGVSEKMTNRALHLLSLELGAPVGRQRETAQAGSWSRWAGRAGSAGRCGAEGLRPSASSRSPQPRPRRGCG